MSKHSFKKLIARKHAEFIKDHASLNHKLVKSLPKASTDQVKK